MNEREWANASPADINKALVGITTYNSANISGDQS